LTDDEAVSKRRFVESIADLAGLERPHRHVPLGVAKVLAWSMERVARWRGAKQAPLLTQARLKFLGLNLSFSVEKAKRELGYQPRVKFEDGIEEAVAWWKAAQGSGIRDQGLGLEEQKTWQESSSTAHLSTERPRSGDSGS
jgi:nucleoside-diphosphate-sugar epimerase